MSPLGFLIKFVIIAVKAIPFTLVIFIGILLFSCSDNSNSNSIENLSEYFQKDFTQKTFGLKPNDTIVYQLKENVKSILPSKHQYYIDTKFQLIGKGDSSLSSVNFKYLSIDWIWIKNGDTLRVNTSNQDSLINTEAILNNILNIEYDFTTTKSTNWEEFYYKIKEGIISIRDKPQDTRQGLYSFYNTLFNSNWIRAKVRQIFKFGPKYTDYTADYYKVGTKWTFNLPIEHEAKSLHPVLNTCIVDSMSDDEIFASINGKLYGQPTLFNPKCISGNLIINRKQNLLNNFNIQQHMIASEIPLGSFQQVNTIIMIINYI